MNQEKLEKDKLKIAIELLNYHGPLFIRMVTDIEPNYQKKASIVTNA